MVYTLLTYGLWVLNLWFEDAKPMIKIWCRVGNKNNYIDSYLQRGLNASEVCVGLNNALCGTDDSYKWFLG